MRSVSHFELAWELHQAGMSPGEIGRRVHRDRATVYRWLRQTRLIGIREFVRRKQTAKRRRQPRKLHGVLRQRIISLRKEHGWCGQKIQKELAEVDGVSVCLMSIYRVLHTELAVGRKRPYRKRGLPPQATAPRQVVQHDTVDFGELFAFTSIDIFSKEPSVVMAAALSMEAGAAAFRVHHARYGAAGCHQSDEGPEFQTAFVAAVTATGARHRYARPYKKNDQSYIENFNRSLRSECLGWGKYQVCERPTVQAWVDAWIAHWMEERWHMGLPEMMTPAQHLAWYTKQEKVGSVAFAL